MSVALSQMAGKGQQVPGTGLDAAFPAHDWIESCTLLKDRRGGSIIGDVPSARRRILEMSRGRCTFDVSDERKFGGFSAAAARVGRVDFKYLSWSSQTQCETETFRSRDHHVAVHIPLRGEFEASQTDEWIKVRPGEALVVSAPGPSRRRWEGHCDLLNIMIEREAIEQSLTRGVVDGVPDLLDRRPLTLIDLGGAVTLTRFVETIIHDLNQERPAFADQQAGMHAEHVLVMLLVKSLSAAAERLKGEEKSRIAPYYVRRAEAYMREHFQAFIEPEDLARASGVSERTLYYGFRTYRDVTPMQYLKDMRLINARRILIEAQSEGGRVGDIAPLVGYANKSQFSRDYRLHFGETPTDTLRGPLR